MRETKARWRVVDGGLAMWLGGMGRQWHGFLVGRRRCGSHGGSAATSVSWGVREIERVRVCDVYIYI